MARIVVNGVAPTKFIYKSPTKSVSNLKPKKSVPKSLYEKVFTVVPIKFKLNGVFNEVSSRVSLVEY